MSLRPLVNHSHVRQRCSMGPERLLPGDPRLSDVLALIQRVFAEHDGRIDPPSSMLRLVLTDLDKSASDGEVWMIGAHPKACVLLSQREEALYVSKLAVDASARGQGLARHLMRTAETRARQRGLTALVLQTRVELEENHATFRALGFEQIGETAHPGFDRPTSITFRKRV